MQTSLLWPDGAPGEDDVWTIDDALWTDLELERLLALLYPDHSVREAVAGWWRSVPLAPGISRYRQTIVRALLASPALRDGIRTALPALRAVFANDLRVFERDTPPFAVIGKRLAELERYVQALSTLHAALGGPGLGDALARLASEVGGIVRGEAFTALTRAVPSWRAMADRARAIHIAINVSPLLTPESAVVTAVTDVPARPESGVLATLLGPGAAWAGIRRLQLRSPVDWTAAGRVTGDVGALLHAVRAPIAKALADYRHVGTQALAGLADELALYLGLADHIVAAGRDGLPWCLPHLGDRGVDRPWIARGMYSPLLAAQLVASGRAVQLVRNDLEFGAEGTLWILTGPNRGGKTTFIRAAGLVQLLAQLGFAVPASEARLHPVDRIHTHFPVPEAGRQGMGRLDEELSRLAAMFTQLTPDGLVLFNELFSGTSAPEGRALAWDVLRACRVAGVNLIYATHLHELAEQHEAIGRSVRGRSAVGSLVAGSVELLQHGEAVKAPTYRIGVGLPGGITYFASELARQYGLTLPQLLATMHHGLAACDAESPDSPAP